MAAAIDGMLEWNQNFSESISRCSSNQFFYSSKEPIQFLFRNYSGFVSFNLLSSIHHLSFQPILPKSYLPRFHPNPCLGLINLFSPLVHIAPAGALFISAGRHLPLASIRRSGPGIHRAVYRTNSTGRSGSYLSLYQIPLAIRRFTAEQLCVA